MENKESNISDNKKRTKYIIIGIGFVLVALLIVVFIFSRSYALEEFGQLNLSCDKLTGIGGDSITCNVTGTVSSTSYVSSLSSQIQLSDNLEFVSFTTDSIWEGTGDNGDIQLYTDSNKTSTFNIGSFVIKIKDGTINTKESISLVNNYFYDNNFEEHSIVDTNVEISTPQYSSEVYEIADEYIITNTKNIAEIIQNINTENCSVIVDAGTDTSTDGVIGNGAKLKIMNNNTVLKELSIIYMGSNSYDLANNYIINTKYEDLINIMDDIEVINGTLSIKNDSLVLSYNSIGIKSYDIINLLSTQYKIDLNKKYILVDEVISDSILDNITNSSNISLSINDETLNINYQDKVIESLKIISVYSDKYVFDLNKGYINIFDNLVNDSLKNDINTNANITIDGNDLVISSNDSNLTTLKIVGISSNKYKLKYGTSNYIYTISDNNIDSIKKNVSVINGDIAISDGKLQLLYKDNLVYEFKLLYLDSNAYKISNNTVYIKEATDYSLFTQNLLFNDMNFEIYDTNNNKVTSNNIDDGFTIKLYFNDILLDTYMVKTEYLEINNLSVKEDEKIIYNISLNTTYDDLIKNIDTSGEITILNKSGNEVSLDSKVKTFDTINIKLSSGEVKYTVSVFGDITGSGNVNAGDIAKMYQGVKGKITLDNISILAGDVTKNGKVEINDVAKAYSYLKGRLSSLG